MKKLVSLVLSLAMLAMVGAGCSNQSGDSSQMSGSEASSQLSETSQSQNTEPVDVRVGALKGPTAMGMVKLMKDSEEEEQTGNNRYEFTIAGAADELTPKIVQGELDLCAVPANLASVLYNNTEGKVQVVAINTLGVLYIVESGDTVHSVEDLRGKTIYASGKGATPEFALNYVLEANGLEPGKDVIVEYKAEHTECVAALTADQGAIAMLPQPFVTTAQMKNPDIRVAIDLNDAWDQAQAGKENQSALLTGVVVVRTEFAKEHPEAVSEFLDSYQASVDFVNNNVDEGAALVGEYDIVTAEVAQKALPYCNIVMIEGEEMKEKLSGYLAVLADQNPQSIGGELPDDAFYYAR